MTFIYWSFTSINNDFKKRDLWFVVQHFSQVIACFLRLLQFHLGESCPDTLTDNTIGMYCTFMGEMRIFATNPEYISQLFKLLNLFPFYLWLIPSSNSVFASSAVEYVHQNLHPLRTSFLPNTNSINSMNCATLFYHFPSNCVSLTFKKSKEWELWVSFCKFHTPIQFCSSENSSHLPPYTCNKHIDPFCT